MEEIAGLLDVDWVEYAVVDDKEEARGMGRHHPYLGRL